LDALLEPNFGWLSGSKQLRRQLQSAGELCNATMQEVLNDPTQESFQWECSCTEVINFLDGSKGSYNMRCTSTCGHFCNRHNDACLIPGFVQGFNSEGVNYLFSQTYQYTFGRTEFIDRKVFFNFEGTPFSCRYDIDEATCQSCQIIPCTSGGAPIELHCENILDGSTFDFCADPTPAVEEGVFQFLNPQDFLTCTPLPPPTPEPIQTTSPPLSSPTIRPVMGKVVPQEGVNQEGVNQEGVNQEGVNQEGVNQEGVNGSSTVPLHYSFHLLDILLLAVSTLSCWL